MSNTVRYKDWILGKGSEAYKLFEEKKFQALDKHLKMLESNERDLIKRYDTKGETNEK